MAKVLIVEDEKVLNEAYELILKKQGHDVKSALNGAEALELVKDEKPDLILLDLRMPKMDGVQFLEKIEPAKNFPNTKIIVFSNYDNHQEIEEAYKKGADRYILKAWSSPAELVKLVRDTLEDGTTDKS